MMQIVYHALPVNLATVSSWLLLGVLMIWDAAPARLIPGTDSSPKGPLPFGIFFPPFC